jgi:long-chain fatty acid transport protein
MRFNPAWPPALFAAWSDRYQGRGWGVGAGMTVPWGGNVLWPLGWPGRFRIMGVDQRTYAFFFNGGVEIIPQLRIGGGFNYYRTTERLKQGTNFLGTESWAELSDAGGAPSWQVSAEFTPFADVPLKLGVDYKHQAVQTLKGRAHFENPPPALAPETLDQDVSHRYTVPNSMHVGLAYQASKRLLLAAAVSMDRFEVYKEDRFVGSAGTTIVVPRDLSNAYTYRLGAEYDLNERWKLRAGVERDVGVTPTDRLSPSLPDASSWNGSVGAAFALRPNLSLEGTYFYAHMDRIQSTGTEPLPGIYDIYAHIVSVGLNWHMAAGSR